MPTHSRSRNTRWHPPLPGHTHTSCSTCLHWALQWRERALTVLHAPRQMTLPITP
ncbi:deazapurine DNA modification protein DpdA family protein [Streptomyces griseosporeus]